MARGIPSATGPTAGRQRFRISRFFAADITERCTRRGTRARAGPAGGPGSGGPAGPGPPPPPPPRGPPPPATVPADPIEALRVSHDSHGLRLDARTACAGWLGGGPGLASRMDGGRRLGPEALRRLISSCHGFLWNQRYLSSSLARLMSLSLSLMPTLRGRP